LCVYRARVEVCESMLICISRTYWRPKSEDWNTPASELHANDVAFAGETFVSRRSSGAHLGALGPRFLDPKIRYYQIQIHPRSRCLGRPKSQSQSESQSKARAWQDVTGRRSNSIALASECECINVAGIHSPGLSPL